MANYTFKWQLEEKGFKEIPWEDWDKLPNGKGYKNKDFYVDNYLMQAIRESNSGWENVKYKLFKKDKYIEEYIVLCYDTKTDEGRYINVSGNSLAAIGQVAFDNLF